MKEKRKPKQKPATEWCDHVGNVSATNGKRHGKRPSHVRCPKCRRRLVPQTKDEHDEFAYSFDPYYIIPPHKIPHSKR